ncbi:MAG TPA: right-handed parallel beta-helix repeat-containing protein [Chitinivibrionales bacterium]|nr:right-handed parallel beta-helix repeat-containing protein [Chitinivibrionales bacterium]
MIISALSGITYSSTLTVAKSGGAYTTIQAAVNAANAGDTVLVQAGTYNEAVAFGISGSASGSITLKGEAGAIVDGTGKGELGISIASRNYIKVIGMEVRNFSGTNTPIGISVEGSSSNLEIRNNKVHNIENDNGNAHGIAFYGTSATPISAVIVDSNEVDSCKLGQSESMVLNGNVTDFTVTNNAVHDNDNIGIDFIGFEGNGPAGQDQARSGVCAGNRVYNISSATNPTYGGDRSADGIYVDGGMDIVIERNIVDNCDIGIEVASEHGGKTTSGITVRSNFVSRSYQGNIMSGGYAASKGNADSIVIVNNTLYHGQDGEVILQYNCSGITIKNNICAANTGTAYLSNSGSNNTGVAVDNNLYYGASTTSPGSWADTHAMYANPLLVNAPADLHIQSTSPAKNAGATLASDVVGTLDIDGQARVQDGIIDIGADEFGTATVLTPYRITQQKLSHIFSTERSIVICGLDPGISTTVQIFSVDGKCLRTIVGKSTNGTMVIDNAGLAAGRYWVTASGAETKATGMVGVFNKK